MANEAVSRAREEASRAPMSSPRAFPRALPATPAPRQRSRRAPTSGEGLPKPPPLLARDSLSLPRRRQVASLARRFADSNSLSLASPWVLSPIKEELGGTPSQAAAQGALSSARPAQPASGQRKAPRRLGQNVFRAWKPPQQTFEGFLWEGAPLTPARTFAETPR